MQILPLTDLRGALTDAERLRERIAALDLSDCGVSDPVTLSIGLTQYRAGEPVMQTLARTDAALYEAKHGGRTALRALSEVRRPLRRGSMHAA